MKILDVVKKLNNHGFSNLMICKHLNMPSHKLYRVENGTAKLTPHEEAKIRAYYERALQLAGQGGGYDAKASQAIHALACIEATLADFKSKQDASS